MGLDGSGHFVDSALLEIASPYAAGIAYVRALAALGVTQAAYPHFACEVVGGGRALVVEVFNAARGVSGGAVAVLPDGRIQTATRTDFSTYESASILRQAEASPMTLGPGIAAHLRLVPDLPDEPQELPRVRRWWHTALRAALALALGGALAWAWQHYHGALAPLLERIWG